MCINRHNLSIARKRIQDQIYFGCKNRDEFLILFRWVIRALDLHDAAAGELPVGRATIKRWLAGTSAPRVLARKSVYRFLLRKIEEEFE